MVCWQGMVRAVVVATICFGTPLSAFDGPAQKTYLLRGSEGQVPNDPGDDATKAEASQHAELGKCIKIDLKNSIGERKAKVENWKPFTAVGFDIAVEKPITLRFSVRHADSKNYATRVDHEVKIAAGKSTIRLPMDTLKNTNGSNPNWEHVVRWYFSLEGENAPSAIIYLGDVWLEGGSPTSAKKVEVKGDPARLARIKSATMPALTKPVSFDTPEADKICSALEVYPPNNPWNLVIEDWPTHPNSAQIVNSVGADKPIRCNRDMGFMLIPSDQKKVDVKITEIPEESDKGPFPVPDDVPIEGWPMIMADLPKAEQLTLQEHQQDKKGEGGDRHAIVVDPFARILYEFYVMKRKDGGWTASQASIFDLKSNKLRPDGWTSADAAGLPIFPAVVRYDEIQRGMVEHAMRFTITKSRRAYVYPATHYASKLTDENLPRMGERFRLKKDVDISKFKPETQAILKGLKRYGMFVADNGIDWAISITPDSRIPDLHQEFRRLKGSDFEVVVAPEGYKPPTDD